MTAYPPRILGGFLFDNFFCVKVLKPVLLYYLPTHPANMQKRGRNPELITRRNQKLAARYYWYAVILELNTDRCLENLMGDFDLAKATIYDIINQQSEIVTALAGEEIDVRQLQRWFPGLSWTYYFPSSSSPTFEQWFLARRESVHPASQAR